jgi:hypothetical protein
MDVGAIKEVLRVCKRLDECHLVNATRATCPQEGRLHLHHAAGVNKAFLTEELICVIDEKTRRQVAGVRKPRPKCFCTPAPTKPARMCSAWCTRTDDADGVFAVRKIHRNPRVPEMIGNFKIIPAPYGRPGTTEIFDVAEEFVKNTTSCCWETTACWPSRGPARRDEQGGAAESIAKVLYHAERIGRSPTCRRRSPDVSRQVTFSRFRRRMRGEFGSRRPGEHRH